MEVIKKVDIIKNIDNNLSNKVDEVIVEHNLTIYINEDKYVSIMCTPKNIDLLVVGFIYSEGLISKYSDILDITFNKTYNEAHVSIENKDVSKDENKTITTAFGNVRTLSYDKTDTLNGITSSNIDVTYSKILGLMEEFSSQCDLFFRTGAVHTSCLSDGNAIITKQEDVGRHNAFDKIIGYCLKNNITLDDKLLLTSGRLSSEMTLKVVRINIPILVSFAAPTSLAIEVAKQHNLTLIGFVRGNKMNIYNNVLIKE